MVGSGSGTTTDDGVETLKVTATEVDEAEGVATNKMVGADDATDETSELVTGAGTIAVDGTPPALAAPGMARRPDGLAAVGSGGALIPQASAMYALRLFVADPRTTSPHLSAPRVPPLKPQLILHFSKQSAWPRCAAAQAGPPTGPAQTVERVAAAVMNVTSAPKRAMFC